MRHIIFAACLTLQAMAAQDETSLFDRMIWRIGKISYSQRQLQSSIFTKRVLENAIIDGNLFSSSHWPEILEEFKLDMIIIQEAKKLGRFQPSTRTVDEKTQLIRVKLKDKDFFENAKLAGLDEMRIVAEVPNALTVIDFRRTKEKSQEYSPTLKFSWVDSLLKAYHSSLYSNAVFFRAITPQ